MKQTKLWVNQLLKALETRPAKISAVFDQLVYGMPVPCRKGSIKQQFMLYLNEDVPEMLVAVAEGEREMYLNLRETQVLLSSSRHELEHYLVQGQYILLKSDNEELTLLYEGDTPPAKAAQREQRDIFLQFIRFYVQQLTRSPFEVESLLLYSFIAVDRNQNMTLQKSEVGLLLARMRMRQNEQFENISRFVRKEEMNEAQITFCQFEKIMKLMQCRNEFKPVYERLASRNLKSYKLYMEKILPIKVFLDFVKNEQMETSEGLRWAGEYFSNEQKISFYDFCRYIASRGTLIYNQLLEQDPVDLTKSLTSYHCFSSHNTYLTGNQLTSDSKAERYREDLQNGYRCLEIDVHNGSEGPIVKHGFTMTSAVSFEEVVQAIANFSNMNPNHTPIILSLENHTNEKQQFQMSQILKNGFGDKILTIQPHIATQAFPSLKQTIGKVIIKNPASFLQYQLANQGTSVTPNQGTSVTPDRDSSEQQEQMVQMPSPNIDEYSQQAQEQFRNFLDLKKQLQNQKGDFLKSQHVFRRFIGRRSSEVVMQQSKKKEMHPEMLRLTSILGKGSMKKGCIWESVSLNQGTIQNYFLTDFAFLKKWTEKHWIRCYPSPSRVDSSNYNPITALELGVQLPAINSQQVDHFTAIMRLFFRRGRKVCMGYRLKSQSQGQNQEINIRPVSCSNVSSLLQPTAIPDIQVRMSFLGCAYDMFQNPSYIKMQPFTEKIKDNAYNPIFDQARVMHLKVSKPQYAFLLVEVGNCGISAISIEGLKRGYRHAALLDNTLQERKAKLFFKVD